MAEARAPGFRNANLLRMFPSFVWKAETEPATHRPLNEAIIRKLEDIGAPLDGLGPMQSWQSDHRLHAADALQGLVALVAAAADRLLAELRVDHQGMRITGCWANVNGPGAQHPMHSHPNNYLSGVYYIRTPAGADTINFHDPRPQVGIIRPPVRELTAETADLVVVKVEAGTLLLFPAWLQHSIDPNRSGEMRISISFNLMFSAYAESMAAPSWEGGRRRSG